jgi:hypothetical protein
VQQQVVLQLLQLHACSCAVQLSCMLLTFAGVICFEISLQENRQQLYTARALF